MCVRTEIGYGGRRGFEAHGDGVGPTLFQFGRGCDGNLSALVHDCDPITEAFGLLDVVGGQQDRRPLFVEFGDEFPEVVAQLDVDARGRFVENQEVGFGDEGSSEQQATFHSPGEPVEALVALVVDPDALEDLVGSFGGLVFGDSVVAGLVHQDFLDRKEAIDVELLGCETNRVAGLLVVVLDVVAEDPRLATGLTDQTDQGVDKGRLPRPVGAEQAEEFAFLDGQ